jgi:hypothetical protein
LADCDQTAIHRLKPQFALALAGDDTVLNVHLLVLRNADLLKRIARTARRHELLGLSIGWRPEIVHILAISNRLEQAGLLPRLLKLNQRSIDDHEDQDKLLTANLDDEIIRFIADRIAIAPPGVKLAEVHIQIIKWHRQLRGATAPRIVHELGIATGLTTDVRKARKLAPFLFKAGLQANRLT